jgi:two-component system, LytTR family, response regulator
VKIRTLIVDDEPLARERLRTFLTTEPTVEVVGECGTGIDAIAAIRDMTPELVFLDMQMPGCDGLQVLAELAPDRRPAVIFATAHQEFAVDAFDVAAVDYLLKPFDRERLQQALRRAQEHLDRSRGGARVPVAEQVARRSDRIAVKADGRLVFLQPEEILRLEAADNYVILHLTTGRLMVRETMGALEARLGAERFVRINRSAIVHADQIREIQPAQYGDHTIVLRDGTRLPLSRSLRSQLSRFATGARSET